MYRREHTLEGSRQAAGNLAPPTPPLPPHRPFNLLPTSLFTCILLVSLQRHLRLKRYRNTRHNLQFMLLIECPLLYANSLKTCLYMHQHLLGHLVNLLLSSPAAKGEVSSTCTAMLMLRGDPVMQCYCAREWIRKKTE